MALTVLSVAHPLCPVGSDAVGGAEQVLATLDRALVERGHRSIVVAREGSSCKGELVATPAVQGPFDEDAVRLAHARHRVALERAIELHRPDVVHMHGFDFDRHLPPAGPTVLATIHLPPGWYAPQVFRLDRPDTHLQCVSLSQRAACPKDARIACVIPNGVDLDRFSPRGLKRGFALRLHALRIGGRIAAVTHGFLDKGRAYYYLGGFDPAFGRLSPGTLIVGHAIEEAAREGALEFDFLRGREAYKYRFGARDRVSRRRLIRSGAVQAGPAA